MQKSRIKTGSEINLLDSCWYLNRELTWLEFNNRVLHEAEDERTPLLERLKFIAIVSANLDEFFMKRIGGLKQQVGSGTSRFIPVPGKPCCFVRLEELICFNLGMLFPGMEVMRCDLFWVTRNANTELDEEEVRSILDVHLHDCRSAWDMQPDGSYIQQQPADSDTAGGSHCRLIEHAEKRVELHRKRVKKKGS